MQDQQKIEVDTVRRKVAHALAQARLSDHVEFALNDTAKVVLASVQSLRGRSRRHAKRVIGSVVKGHGWQADFNYQVASA